jgi:hypothetical protein
VLVIAGCATAGRNFKTSSIPMIKINRTRESQIRHWFGDPYEERTVRTSDFKSRILHFAYAKETLNGISRNRELFVEIFDDYVYSYWFHSAFEEDATDFNTELIDQLKIGETNVSDTKGVLGAPGGKYQLPSNLISDEVADEAPEDTKEIWMYFFGTVERANIPKVNAKLLILFFDDSGTLTHLDFTENA